MFGRKENILVVKTDGLAAFVAAEPVFEAIRNAYPNAKISLLTEAGLQRLARSAPWFDQVAAMPKLEEPEMRKAFVRQLRNARFARAFDLSADAESKKLQSALGIFGPKWHAAEAAPKPKRGKSGFAVPDLSRLCGEAGLKVPERLPDLSWAAAARQDSANMQPSWFGVSGVYGLLLPSEAAERRWPAAHYADLAKRMTARRITPVLCGGRDLHAFGDEVAAEEPQIVDLTGKTDHLQLTSLAKEAAFFVGDEAEEMLLAASVGCQGVHIRKASDPSPPIEGRHVVALTTKADMAEASADFVWRTLNNMGLIVDGKGAPRAAALR
jgi:ADP-heptose:LPS heptosyltransferase